MPNQSSMMTALAIILTASCAILTYSWIDSRVTIDYLKQELESQHQKQLLLQEVFQLTGPHLSRSEMTRLIKGKLGSKHIVKETPDQLIVDEIVFEFTNDHLAAIKSLEDQQ